MQIITSTIVLFVTNMHYPFLIGAGAHDTCQADMMNRYENVDNTQTFS